MDKLGEIPSLDILQRSLKNSPGCHWLVLRSDLFGIGSGPLKFAPIP